MGRSVTHAPGERLHALSFPAWRRLNTAIRLPQALLLHPDDVVPAVEPLDGEGMPEYHRSRRGAVHHRLVLGACLRRPSDRSA